MNKLTTLFLTATLTLASGAALAADTSGMNNGQANAGAEAGQVAPGANQNIAPKGVDNSNINNSGTMLHPNGSTSNSGLTSDGMSKDEIHKNSMCKDGKCPDTNQKVETGSGNDVNSKVDGTSQ
ncbi:putative secreted protein [Buttiauxella ferragutiae ATCC 51602]|uniref:Secreted protein n=2 Tax=Enterobacteriaceae TaxID=543 RepID=A0ABX2W7Z0_9ENTR|nr:MULTISPECIES: YbgS-like family protein [Buttiauxella]OAT27242.1 putative secreted protein [Buttiauxella ferragutiae ATCC 51602]TDN55273.1 YbgS-like protein [Buttiauxella sp. JUb87]